MIIKRIVAIVGLVLALSACTADQVKLWVWVASDTETVLTDRQARAWAEWLVARRGPAVPPVLVAISSCESGNGHYGHFDYTVRNPRSSASGRYQFLNSTWSYVATRYASTWQANGWETLRREATAVGSMASARPAVQDAAALVLLQREGTGPWSSSRGCWGRWA